jgi:hypothetical protein
MLTTLQSANLLVRFLLEMAALAAIGSWTWRLGGSRQTRVVRTTIAVVGVMAIWSTFVHGEAIPPVVAVGTQIAVLGAGAAVILRRNPRLAAGFCTTALANAALMGLWHQ